jgi:poly-gamma-glutamate capsule biosynthesis protein CapA/YwtB (metallophosphatase superfamily)
VTVRLPLLATVLLLAALLAACTGGPDRSVGAGRDALPTVDPEPSSRVAPRPARPVTIAFAGDTHFAGVLAPGLAKPATAMGTLATKLAEADLAILNLETAVTVRGTPEPKEFVFRSPPVVFDALAGAGIDVVTMANNHALDYGPVSVPDARSAADDNNFPVIGIGRTAREAFRPWITTVKGQRIAFLGATAVVDSALVATWSAGPRHAGVATALDGDNAALVAAIRRVRPEVDTVVVDMHYGSDLQQCPTDIQRGVVRDAIGAGADVVIGQHAHVLLGAGYSGSAYVSYGLGNFQFYSASGTTAETGVLTLTVDGRRVTDPVWTPGTVVAGRPQGLDRQAADAALRRWQSLQECTGLQPRPTPR